jgi:hypothetical protein
VVEAGSLRNFILSVHRVCQILYPLGTLSLEYSYLLLLQNDLLAYVPKEKFHLAKQVVELRDDAADIKESILDIVTNSLYGGPEHGYLWCYSAAWPTPLFLSLLLSRL